MRREVAMMEEDGCGLRRMNEVMYLYAIDVIIITFCSAKYSTYYVVYA